MRNNTKLSYTTIKEKFEKEGYILLSTEYIGKEYKLEYLCPNNHRHSTSYNNFRNGWRCPYCSNKIKYTYDFIKNKFYESGYTLLSKEYKGAHSKLECICPKGHTINMSWHNLRKGHGCLKCANLGRRKAGNSQWKGDVKAKNIPLYETYAPQLEQYQTVHRVYKDDLILLGVECIYCSQIFVPKERNVRARLYSIRGIVAGEHNLYCSENCKKACPTYRQRSYPKGFKLATSREVQPELRKLVLTRDNYRCQICDIGLEEAELHCHHIESVSQNPIESADIDNCIILCKKHHKQVHTLPDCGYNELSCVK